MYLSRKPSQQQRRRQATDATPISIAAAIVAVSKDSAMTINKFRGWLYLIAKLLGDYNAVRKGRVARRIGYRISGKMTGRALGGLFR